MNRSTTPRTVAIALAVIFSAGCKTEFNPEDDADADTTADPSGEEGVAQECGNGDAEGTEECDDGANGVADDGCTDGCTYSCHSDAECDDGLGCTDDVCVASTHTCDHDLLGIGVECRPAGHPVCNPAEYCDGASQDCPGDGFAIEEEPCEDGDPCTTVSECDGAGLCIPVPPAPTAIAAGGSHACVLTPAGGVKCWGSNLVGQLGMGDYDEITTAIQVVEMTEGVTQISADYEHTCALEGGGSIRCWGDDDHGQLGDGTVGGDGYVPAAVAGLPGPAIQVSAGGYHTCAVLGTSEVSCWGDNGYGQLGSSLATPADGPVLVPGLTGVTQVSAGGYHTCARTGTGDVLCWGDNSSGQMGVPAITSSSTPLPVEGLPSGQVLEVATGDWHTCALLSGHDVMCWGDASYGQLGNGDEDASATPVGVIGLADGASRIFAGPLHTCVIGLGGQSWCWGTNSCWVLADDVISIAYAPIQVEELAGTVSRIAPGGDMTCAIEDGWAECWGCSTYHQLGSGTDYQGPVPVRVCGL